MSRIGRELKEAVGLALADFDGCVIHLESVFVVLECELQGFQGPLHGGLGEAR